MKLIGVGDVQMNEQHTDWTIHEAFYSRRTCGEIGFVYSSVWASVQS